MMWSNIGKVEEYKDDMEFLPSPRYEKFKRHNPDGK